MSNQIVITSGAKVRSLEGVITGSAGVLGSVPLGAANGVATLDSGGKVPVSQLPSSVVTYLGTWNAATNTPTLVNGVGDAGDMYICNVAGTVNFGAGPVTFAVGDWVLYGSGTWQKSNGQNGTVTSVGASITGNAIGLTGSPITTAGTLAFAFSGTSGQYVNGAGNLTTFPTLITSIGLSMPSAFSVANSPLTANGSINVTGAGTTSQYIDGTGALQTFPALTGYVPYTGATTDVDLGTHVLNAQALHVKGTAGAGHLGLKHQTASPTGSANESLIFADVNGNLGWQNDNLYLTTLVSNANTANRSYTFPNASGTLALTSDISYPVTSVFGRTGAVTAQSGDYTTTLVTEGTRLYYTDTRARAALSFTAGSGAYNSTTGVITIPTNTSQLTNGANFITLASLSAGAGISYNNTTGVISSTITQYTDAMARAAISGGTGISYNSTTGVITNTITQYTDALARAAISLTTTGTSGAATYNSTTGVLNIPQYTDAYTGTVTSVAMTVPTGLSVSGSPITTSGTLAVTLTAGYSIPTTASQTNWDNAYTNRITSATSPLSITSNVISISQSTTSTSGYLSSTDWNTFNSKQGTITLTTTGSSGAATLVSNTLNVPNYTLSGLGGIGGSGTANYLPKFTAGTTIGNSVIYESTGGNIGIGENNPASYKLQVKGADGSGIQYEDTNAVKTLMGSYSSESIIGSLSNHSVGFWSNNTKKMTLNTSGNLGLGVTPSAWNSYNALQINGGGSFVAYGNAAEIWSNAIYDGSNKYIANGYATRFHANNSGAFVFYTAPSGTAGSAISFTQAMTLTASGNLLVGTTTETAGYKLQVNGFGRFINTNTVLNFGELDANNIYFQGLNLAGNTSKGFVFYGTSEYMRIFSDGNVGINTGNTNAGYKLDVNGTGRFSGNTTIAGDIILNSDVTDRKIYFRTSGGSPDGNWTMGNYLSPTGATVVTSAATVIDVYGGGGSAYGFMIRNTLNAPLLQIAGGTGAATFSSSVTAGGDITSRTSLNAYTLSNIEPYVFLARNSGSNGIGVIRTLDGGALAFDNGATGAAQSTKLTIASTGAATFSSSVAATQANINYSGAAYAINATSNWTPSVSNNPIITFGRTSNAVAGAIGYDDSQTALYIGTTTAHNFIIKSGSTIAATFVNSGAVTFSSTLGINGVSDNVKSGTYTPTINTTTNISSSSVGTWQYLRVGNTVTVSGSITITPTLGISTTSFNFSLPINSTFATGNDCAGTGVDYNATTYLMINGNSGAANYGLGLYKSTTTSAMTLSIQFTYIIK